MLRSPKTYFLSNGIFGVNVDLQIRELAMGIRLWGFCGVRGFSHLMSEEPVDAVDND